MAGKVAFAVLAVSCIALAHGRVLQQGETPSAADLGTWNAKQLPAACRKS